MKALGLNPPEAALLHVYSWLEQAGCYACSGMGLQFFWNVTRATSLIRNDRTRTKRVSRKGVTSLSAPWF